MINVKPMLEYTKSLRVLYIEDDEVLLEATKELFDDFFACIDVAYDGVEGYEKYLEFYQENSNYYDLVITDIQMPKLNGIEMSKKILKLHSTQPIIITSAHHELDYLAAAIDLGISGFISKPLQNEKLINIFYRNAQAISDHKFVLKHVDMMEEMNIQLENQNQELMHKNTELEKSLRILDTIVHKDNFKEQEKEKEKEVNTSALDKHMKEQIKHLIEDDLDELIEIHSEIDIDVITIINSTDLIDIQTLTNLTDRFAKYASVLSVYSFFNELGSAMSSFSRTLKENPLPDNDESVTNIFMLLESFMYVLGKWQDDLASGDESKINSLDASIISDMHTITNMWTQKEEKFVEEDLDGIFDF